MKLGTAARIAKISVGIALFIVLSLPVVLAILPAIQDGESPITRGTDAEFELNLMDEDKLASNLKQVDGNKSDLYAIVGDTEMAYTDYSMNQIAKKAYESGVDVVTVMDRSTGEIATTQSIDYGNLMLQGVHTGIKTKGLLSSVAEIKLEYSNYFDDGNGSIPWDSVFDDGDMRIIMPNVAFAASLACGSAWVGADLSISYAKMFTIKVDLDTGELDYDVTARYFVSEEGGHTIILSGYPAEGEGMGTIGDCKYGVSHDNITITRHGEKISDSLKASLEDGGIELVICGMKYTMPDDMAEGFISAIEYIEVNYLVS